MLVIGDVVYGGYNDKDALAAMGGLGEGHERSEATPM
jgi:hypothetical protein